MGDMPGGKRIGQRPQIAIEQYERIVNRTQQHLQGMSGVAFSSLKSKPKRRDRFFRIGVELNRGLESFSAFCKSLF